PLHRADPKPKDDGSVAGQGRASKQKWPAPARVGSWLCENSSARRARRNISKKLRATESTRAARTMFDTLSENCILYISQLYEFSHRLGHHRPAGDLKYRIVVVGADETNIPLRPLGPISIATEIHGRETALDLELSHVQAAYGHGSHPTGKGAGVDDIRLVPATRSEKRCPRLEIQSWRSGKAGAAEYRRLRGRRRLRMT